MNKLIDEYRTQIRKKEAEETTGNGKETDIRLRKMRKIRKENQPYIK